VGSGINDIQGGALRLSAARGSGSGYAVYGLNSKLVSGAHVFSVDVTALSAVAGSIAEFVVAGGSNQSYLTVQFTSPTVANVWVYDSTGASAGSGSATVTSGGPYHVVVTIPASGNIAVTVNGVDASPTYYDSGSDSMQPMPSSMMGIGSTQKVGCRIESNSTTTVESRFDNVSVT
jgi:hypothetical protein